MLSHGMMGPFGMLGQIDALELLRSAWSLLLVILGFSLVVFVHELGHFLAAKWADVRVEKFCIGFGRELFGFTRGETRYGFNLLPLGGYVKMLGQEDFAVDKTGELKVKDDERSFTNKPVGQRMVIVAAGVVMNLIFAAIGLTLYMMVGYRTQPPVVGLVAPSTPAARAGLQPGDRILAVNGSPVREFNDVRMRIVLSDPGEVLLFDVQRDGKPVEPPPRLLPEFQDEEHIRQAGMTSGWTRTVAAMAGGAMDEYSEGELQANDMMRGIVRGDAVEPVRSVDQVWDALMQARGRPVELVVKRPEQALKLDELIDPDDDRREGREARVTAQAGWYLHPEKGSDAGTASLLGLTPRLRGGFPEPDSPADLAGIEPGDVIVRFGEIDHPGYQEFMKLVWQYENRDTPLIVRRPRAANRGLSAEAVRFIAARREAWLEASLSDVAGARGRVLADLGGGGLDANDQAAIRRRIERLDTAPAWLGWLEQADLHELTIRPTRPFSLGRSASPRLGLSLDLPEDDRLVAAQVQEQVGGRESPAFAAGVPRGAVLLSVDGREVRTWADLTEAFRSRSGGAARVRYRLGLSYAEATLSVPVCINTSLNLPEGARIQSVGGLDRVEVLDDSGKAQTLFLPDWRAVRELLQRNVGKTVPVKWAGPDGVESRGEFAVTRANVDPWLLRVAYVPTFICYPMMISIRETNPLQAAWMGIKKTHYVTWSTIQSIRHIAFTQQVGVNQLRGPVGIARMGMQVAETSWTQLLWFMCLISANLAVINALPLPIVDGGLFFFLVLEKIRGEPMSIKTQVVTQILGIALIASVFLFVTFQDIVNWNK